ncbi:hypothetical protein PhCBS80983_g00077 [Powellomyces hirtus]|uniref:Uncharacterized protein n=1 Tax=Powellomyces hirtus TaxID=109895 RepID=A0A507EHX0_9FUNG|nr:hypothetical protein PhCBS80983_g00077 [Powellomyces hirtus]
MDATFSEAVLPLSLATVVVGLVLLRLSQNLRPSCWPASTPHKVYLAQTFHARYQPVRHSFRYPVFYFGVDLDKEVEVPRYSRWLIGWGRKALFSVYAKDHLKGEDTNKEDALKQGLELRQLKVKLLDLLEKLGIGRDEIGRVEFVSTPRVLGYSFNPLSLYYCYTPDTAALRAIVLEVNNTFGERHVYIADERNLSNHNVAGYDTSYNLKRAFHVSPFNNRSGVYEAHFKDPARGYLDVLLNIKRYDGDTTQSPKDTGSDPLRLSARVSGESFPLTTQTCLYLMVTYPITAFLTVPRILKEAWKLAYQHKLKVYQKPAQHLFPPDGQSLVWKAPVGFPLWCSKLVEKHVTRQVDEKRISVTLRLPNGAEYVSEPCEGGKLRSKKNATILVVTPTFFTDLVTHHNDVGESLIRTFVRGDWSCAPQDMPTILDVFRRTGPSLGSHPWQGSDAPGFAPLQVDQSWKGRMRLWVGSSLISCTQAAFGKVANFAVDPYGVQRRIERYREDLTSHGVSSDSQAYAMDNGANTEQRERARFETIWKELHRAPEQDKTVSSVF